MALVAAWMMSCANCAITCIKQAASAIQARIPKVNVAYTTLFEVLPPSQASELREPKLLRLLVQRPEGKCGALYISKNLPTISLTRFCVLYGARPYFQNSFA